MNKKDPYEQSPERNQKSHRLLGQGTDRSAYLQTEMNMFFAIHLQIKRRYKSFFMIMNKTKKSTSMGPFSSTKKDKNHKEKLFANDYLHSKINSYITNKDRLSLNYDDYYENRLLSMKDYCVSKYRDLNDLNSDSGSPNKIRLEYESNNLNTKNSIFTQRSFTKNGEKWKRTAADQFKSVVISEGEQKYQKIEKLKTEDIPLEDKSIDGQFSSHKSENLKIKQEERKKEIELQQRDARIEKRDEINQKQSDEKLKKFLKNSLLRKLVQKFESKRSQALCSLQKWNHLVKQKCHILSLIVIAKRKGKLALGFAMMQERSLKVQRRVIILKRIFSKIDYKLAIHGFRRIFDNNVYTKQQELQQKLQQEMQQEILNSINSSPTGKLDNNAMDAENLSPDLVVSDQLKIGTMDNLIHTSEGNESVEWVPISPLGLKDNLNHPDEYLFHNDNNLSISKTEEIQLKSSKYEGSHHKVSQQTNTDISNKDREILNKVFYSEYKEDNNNPEINQMAQSLPTPINQMENFLIIDQSIANKLIKTFDYMIKKKQSESFYAYLKLYKNKLDHASKESKINRFSHIIENLIQNSQKISLCHFWDITMQGIHIEDRNLHLSQLNQSYNQHTPNLLTAPSKKSNLGTFHDLLRTWSDNNGSPYLPNHAYPTQIPMAIQPPLEEKILHNFFKSHYILKNLEKIYFLRHIMISFHKMKKSVINYQAAERQSKIKKRVSCNYYHEGRLILSEKNSNQYITSKVNDFVVGSKKLMRIFKSEVKICFKKMKQGFILLSSINKTQAIILTTILNHKFRAPLKAAIRDLKKNMKNYDMQNNGNIQAADILDKLMLRKSGLAAAFYQIKFRKSHRSYLGQITMGGIVMERRLTELINGVLKQSFYDLLPNWADQLEELNKSTNAKSRANSFVKRKTKKDNLNNFNSEFDVLNSFLQIPIGATKGDQHRSSEKVISHRLDDFGNWIQISNPNVPIYVPYQQLSDFNTSSFFLIKNNFI